MQNIISSFQMFILSSNLSPSTQSPFLTCMSWCSQSGSWSSFRKKGVVHQITYSFSQFFFTYVLFIHFILDIKNGVLYPVKQLDQFLGNWHSHFSVLSHSTLVCDCFHTALPASIICSQPFRHLNLSPYNPLLPITNGSNMCWQINLQHIAMNRP